ncbi:MAG: sensor histidine kinase [Saprospiraceae bacterium]
MASVTKHTILNTVALHLLVWGILFGFPTLFMLGDAPPAHVYTRTLLPLVFAVILFYLNYFILVERFLFKDQLLLFIFINIILILISIWGIDWLRELVPSPSGRGRRGSGGGWFYKNYAYFRNSFTLLMTVIVSVTVRGMQRWQQLETERKSRETEQLKSTLAHLQYQIQPHFFFNSLNNIYSLVDISPEKAKESIHGMSKLMRYMLYDAKAERVSLQDEIIFLKNYIHLMKLRYTDKVNIQYDFPTQPPNMTIAPLLFIPLVENAFKHGVSASQPSYIFIKMRIENNKQLVFGVENTNFPKPESDKGGSGIGIENLKQRLELLYPGQYSFTQNVKNEVFISELVINIPLE